MVACLTTRRILLLLLSGCDAAQRVTRPADNVPAEDAAFLERLGLLHGRLLIGRRLLGAGMPRLAALQFGGGRREFYGWLEPRLAARGSTGFESALEELEDLAIAGIGSDDPRLRAAWDAAMAGWNGAWAAVPAGRENSTAFLLDHLAAILREASVDYGEAIERGRIVDVNEYHQSMGGILYALSLIGMRRAAMGEDAAAWNQAEAEVQDLRRLAFPTLLPPARPPLAVSNFRNRAARLRAIPSRG